MPSKNSCKICRFWEKFPYRVSERELFNKKCREGTSLRKLELLLEAYGLKAHKDLISKHMRVCMHVDVSTQRQIEKGLKKGKNIGQKLRGFFIPSKEEPMVAEACSHEVTIPVFDLNTERVFSKCRSCGKILRGSVDPHNRRRNRDRNLVVINALRGRRR